jgi:hypothetical protein
VKSPVKSDPERLSRDGPDHFALYHSYFTATVDDRESEYEALRRHMPVEGHDKLAIVTGRSAPGVVGSPNFVGVFHVPLTSWAAHGYDSELTCREPAAMQLPALQQYNWLGPIIPVAPAGVGIFFVVIAAEAIPGAVSVVAKDTTRERMVRRTRIQPR